MGKPVNKPQKAFDAACIHTLRHSFASLALSVGATLYDVSKLLGHAKTQTTARYSHHERGALLKISQQAAGQIGAAAVEKRQEGEDDSGERSSGDAAA